MAKKAAPRKKATSRRRPAAKRAAPRRRSVRRAGFPVMPLLMGIGGAYVAHKFSDKVPIKDARYRNLALTAAALFGAKAMPKAAPLFIGAGIVTGLQTIDAFFPKLGLKSLPSADYPAETNNRLSTKGATIGRLTAAEERQVREAVTQKMRGNMNGMPTMMGLPTMMGDNPYT